MPLRPSVPLALCFVVFVFSHMPSSARGQNTLIPLPKRRDMVFDNAGKFLYITATDGVVRRFNLTAGTIDGSYTLGGVLNGIDIDQTDSLLLVAQETQYALHRIDLKTSGVTTIGFTPTDVAERGAWDVAIASNGFALFTTENYAQQPVRQIDLATNAVSPRQEYVGGYAPISRSADGTRMYFLDISSSGGKLFTYDALTDEFTITYHQGFLPNVSPALNRDGTLAGTPFQPFAATPYSIITTFPDFRFVWAFHGADGGIAFDPVRDIAYVVDTTADSVIAYDLNTGAEVFRRSIGENLSSVGSQFGSGNLVVSRDGQHLAVTTPTGIRLFSLPQTLPAPTPIPTPTASLLRDMIFDHGTNYLYLTTSNGFVWKYNILAQAFETSYRVGGSLNGADIAADDSLLLIAQNDAGLVDGIFHKLDLTTGEVTNIILPSDSRGERGGWDVAIASNNTAFVTRRQNFVGPSQLRQIDLATNTITERSPMGFYLIDQDTQVHRSADRTRLYFMGSDSGGRVFTYNVLTDTFGPIVWNETYLVFSSGAVSRDGSLVGTRINVTASLGNATALDTVHTFNTISGGLAFDAIRDRFYGVNAALNFISGFNTHSFEEEVRIAIGEDVPPGITQFGPGNLVASPDGRYLALLTSLHLRVFDVTNAPPPPPPTPTPTPTPIPSATPVISVGVSPGSVNEGQVATCSIVAQANTSRPVVVSYSISGSATFGADYTLSDGLGPTGQVTIPVGSDSVTFTLTTIIDPPEKKSETLIVKVNPGSGYKRARGAKTKLKIIGAR